MKNNNSTTSSSSPVAPSVEPKSLILKDLHSFSEKDIQILYKYYNVWNVKDLVSKIYKNRDTIFKRSKPEVSTLIYKKGSLPGIFEALKEGNNDVVKQIILTPGFNVNQTDRDGTSVFMYAVIYSKINDEIIKLLLAKGANIDQRDAGARRPTALMRVINSSILGPLVKGDRVKLLLSLGADVNLKDDAGNTALIRAVVGNNNGNEIVKLLMNQDNIDLNIKNNDGNTALMVATTSSSIEIVKLLIAQDNIDLNIKNNDGNTALDRLLDTDIFRSGVVLTSIKLLIDKDSNVTEGQLQLIDKQNDRTLLLWIIDHDVNVPKEILGKMPNYLELKIYTLQQHVKALQRLMDESEINFLNEDPNCISKDIDDLEKCIEKEVKMIKYKAGGEEAKKLEKKYEEHPYFRKK